LPLLSVSLSVRHYFFLIKNSLAIVLMVNILVAERLLSKVEEREIMVQIGTGELKLMAVAGYISVPRESIRL
jgi:hypothetical protein